MSSSICHRRRRTDLITSRARPRTVVVALSLTVYIVKAGIVISSIIVIIQPSKYYYNSHIAMPVYFVNNTPLLFVLAEFSLT